MRNQKGKLPQGKQNRFEFGKNWQRFLSVLDEERIFEAEQSLKIMLEIDNLYGMSFLDIGSGSGLFSLVARRLGAKVHSFDYDPLSVECTKELKKRYFPNDLEWTIEQGDVLNKDYLKSLGTFDIVYSWGVLHHTGAMWEAMKNIIPLVGEGGKLYIAIYNDQGNTSKKWAKLKKFYNHSPKSFKISIILIYGVLWFIRSFWVNLINFQNPLSFKQWRDKKKNRGMSFIHDIVDWVGGYPFEVAKPEDIFKFFHNRGFELVQLKTVGGRSGCNEFVFLKGKNRLHMIKRDVRIEFLNKCKK